MTSLHLSNKEQTAVQLNDASGADSPPIEAIYDNDISHVSEKYRGTAADVRDMSVLGKKQVLRVKIPPGAATLWLLSPYSETSISLPCSASRRHV